MLSAVETLQWPPLGVKCDTLVSALPALHSQSFDGTDGGPTAPAKPSGEVERVVTGGRARATLRSPCPVPGQVPHAGASAPQEPQGKVLGIQGLPGHPASRMAAVGEE